MFGGKIGIFEILVVVFYVSPLIVVFVAQLQIFAIKKDVRRIADHLARLSPPQPSQLESMARKTIE
jgi:hypothetical protein